MQAEGLGKVGNHLASGERIIIGIVAVPARIGRITATAIMECSPSAINPKALAVARTSSSSMGSAAVSLEVGRHLELESHSDC